MAQLKSREKAIPGGFRYYIPQTKWASTPWASFDTVVRQVIAHRQGNPTLTKKYNWSTDYASVAAEVEAFNAAMCEQNGWMDYILQGVPQPPKTFPRHNPTALQSARNVAAGAASNLEWLGEGGIAVPPAQSEERAKVCARGDEGKPCPMNQKGDLTSWFTIPAAAKIKQMIEAKNNRKLATPDDEGLGICSACSCPLPLLVHVPLAVKLKHMPQAAHEALWPKCWVKIEGSGK